MQWLRVVKLNEGLRAVNDEGFYDSSIEKIYFSSTVKLIDDSGFCACKKLRHAIFPENSVL